MKKEYDFAKATRGKFYRADEHLKLPIYLDDDVVEMIEKYATKKKTDAQTVVNKVLRQNRELLKAS